MTAVANSVSIQYQYHKGSNIKPENESAEFCVSALAAVPPRLPAVVGGPHLCITHGWSPALFAKRRGAFQKGNPFF